VTGWLNVIELFGPLAAVGLAAWWFLPERRGGRER